MRKDAPVCYGYGRHSTAKQEFTRAAQRAKVKEYWRQKLKPKGVRWGGFHYDKAVQGSVEFSEREQGRQVYALAKPGDHVVVSRLDRPFRSVADGVKVIQSLAERKVRFHSLDLLVDSGTPMGRFFVTILLAVAELERAFVSERTCEVIAYRKKHGLPVGYRAPLGWKIVGSRARDTGNKRSTRRYEIDEQERELVEIIYELRKQGMAIEQIVLWLMTQNEYPNKRRLDNYRAVEWAVAAKELGFPKETDGKRMVREWRAARSSNVPSLPASGTRVITLQSPISQSPYALRLDGSRGRGETCESCCEYPVRVRATGAGLTRFRRNTRSTGERACRRSRGWR